MVYPDPAVIAAVSAAFVPLRLDFRDPHRRELNVVWLPTVLIRDHRGNEHYRHVNAAPPDDFLDVLALGEAHARLKEGAPSPTRSRRAGPGRCADRGATTALSIPSYSTGTPSPGIFAAITTMTFATASGPICCDRYPDSVWAHRVPEFLTAGARPD